MSDVKSVTQIIAQAQEYMRNSGIDQWQDGYPNEESIKDDVNRGESFVFVDKESGKIAATAMISLAPEPTYSCIKDGEWKYDEFPYAVIHRIAVSNELKGQGIAGQIFDFASNYALEHGFNYLRVDTHRDNKSMRRRIEKSGFEYSGIIYVEDSTERLAFEKKL